MTRKKKIFLCIVFIGIVLLLVQHKWYQNTATVHSRIIFKSSQEETNVERVQNYGYYSEFQQLNDNMTYVYAGYYDDREEEAEVKVIAEIPREIRYNFTCTVYYPDQSVVQVTGFIKYLYCGHYAYKVKHAFRSGFIICPVSKENGPPTSLSLERKGIVFPKTRVSVKPPPKVKNKLTRCIKPFIRNYDDVSRLIWSIELSRMFGVDKHILYMKDQSQRIMDVVKSYASDGIVEIRNFSILQPETPIGLFIKSEIPWAQWLAYHDCLLSEMYTAKYVIGTDVDEIFVPYKHKTIVEMADDLFAQSKHDPEPAGSLVINNVYYPTFRKKTNSSFSGKDLALKYNIHPLLYTTRVKSKTQRVKAKPIVLPKTIEVMYLHYVERLKKGWKEKHVDKNIATMHHYRQTKDWNMLKNKIEDNYMLRFSSQLISAVEQRFKKVLPHYKHSP